MNNGEMNNRKLYKETFSKLKASDTLKTEAGDMEKIKPRVRFTKIAVACMALLVLTGTSLCLTYAATGGETANPIKGVIIYLDGIELGPYEYTDNGDGSYTIKLDENDDTQEINLVDENDDSEFCVVSGNGDALDGEITYKPDKDGAKFSYTDNTLHIEANAETKPDANIELSNETEIGSDSEPMKSGTVAIEAEKTPSAEK